MSNPSVTHDDQRERIAGYNDAMGRHAHEGYRLLQDAYQAFDRAASFADPGGGIPPAPSVHRFENAKDAINTILQGGGHEPKSRTMPADDRDEHITTTPADPQKIYVRDLVAQLRAADAELDALRDQRKAIEQRRDETLTLLRAVFATAGVDEYVLTCLGSDGIPF